MQSIKTTDEWPVSGWRRGGVRRGWLGAAVAAMFLLGLAGQLAGQSIQDKVAQIINAADLGTFKYGISVVDLATGENLAEFNNGSPLAPASNMKLLTTAAALDTLGTDYIFETQILWDGKSLIIRGDGDPGFGDPELLKRKNQDIENFLAELVAAIRKHGVTNAESILIDDRVFDEQFTHESWPKDQLNAWYAAQVAGINFNTNVLDIFAKPTKPGQAPVVTYRPLAPSTDVLNLNNRAKTGTSNSLWATRNDGSNTITIRGILKHELLSPIYVTVNDPPLFFGRVLRQRLMQAGLKIGPVGRLADGQNIANAQVVTSIKTPLTDILSRCNKDSQNLFAEALLKKLGRQVTGERGSWLNGAAAMRIFLTRKMQAQPQDVTTAVIDDGSGLSRNNRVNTRLLTLVLAGMHRDEKLRTPFMASLAEPGQDGTLKNRFNDQKLRGRMYGKTGTIANVISLSGYLIHEKRQVAFSILFNDYNKPTYRARQLMDKIVLAMDAILAGENPDAKPSKTDKGEVPAKNDKPAATPKAPAASPMKKAG